MIPPRVPTGKVEMAGTAHQPWRKTQSGQKDTTANERAWIRAGHREDRRTSIEGEVSKAGDRPDAPDGSEERPAFPKPAENVDAVERLGHLPEIFVPHGGQPSAHVAKLDVNAR